MEPGPTVSDRDARLLGLALLHGYVEADQLQRAAEANSSPSRILAELRRSGAIDDPCLEGLEQALKDFKSANTPEKVTGPTHMEPPRHLSATSDGGPGKAGSWDDDSGRWNTGARLLHQFTVVQWKHYRNLRFIGEGGMGRIYKAQDPDLKRTVALKFLRGQDLDQLKRFLFEAQAQALMEHPNICRVYEISEWQGQHYIAMQYVNGPTLLRAAPGLDLEEKLRIGEAVAEAVHAAHRRGLIHRDLKPANVLLEKGEGGRFKPYVLDFGLAREMDAPGMTASGLVLGTTAYISPEQAKGEAHHVDRRTDVYGLGATLYELFAGCPPFGEASGMECIRKVLDEEPPPLRALAPHLPRDLETVVMKCLEKDPARRYDDAQSLAEDLRRVREGEPIQARPVTLAFRLRRYARRNRLLVATAAFGFSAVLIATGFAGYVRYTASARARWAQHYGQEAERIEALVRYYRLLPSHDIRSNLLRVRAKIKDLELEGRGLGNLAKGPMAYALGRAKLAIGEHDEAKLLLQTAWQEGFRTGEVSNAYSRVLEIQYQAAVEKIARTSDPDLRNELQTDLERNLLGSLLWHMRAGQGSSMEPGLFQEARLAYYERRFDAAVEKVDSLLRVDPWVFEALKLKAEALQLVAREKSEPAEKAALHAQARAALRTAQGIARSDATLFLEEAKVLRSLMEEGNGSAAEVEALGQECLKVLASARGIGSHNPECDALEAWAWGSIGRSRSEGRADPEGAFRQAICKAQQCLDLAPGNLDALNAMTFAHGYLGLHLMTQGKDATEDFDKALSFGVQALGRNPSDPYSLHSVFKVINWKMGYEISKGLSPEVTYRAGLLLADRIKGALSGDVFFPTQVGNLHNEWADYLRMVGRNPEATVAEALKSFNDVLASHPERENILRGAGMSDLIMGEYLLGKDQDPSGYLDRAVANFEAAIRVQRERAGNFLSAGTCHLFKAIHLLRKGKDPTEAIAKARTMFDQSLKLKPKYPWSWWKLARLEEVEGQWLARQAGPAVASFRRGYTASAKALALNPEAEFFPISIVLCGRLAVADAAASPAWMQKGMQTLAAGQSRHPGSDELLLAGAELWLVKASLVGNSTERKACLSQARQLLEKASTLNGNSQERAAELRRRLSGSRFDSSSNLPG